jgi:YegS/Rv2252/BmrU family lipid kinase
MKRIAFIIHGRIAKNKKLIDEIEHVFNGIDYKLFATTEAQQATVLTQQAIGSGHNYIICVGGDGSLNEVVNGYLTAGVDTSKHYLGLLPYGTGNDFAKTMNISQSVAELKQYIDADSYNATDVGEVQYNDREGNKAKRYFINITDVGMGGLAAEKINGYPKWLPSTLAYQLAILSTLISYKKQDMAAKADSFTYAGRTMNIIVANGKYFGSGLGIAPHAQTNDGKLAVVIAADISLWDYIANISTVRKCQKVQHPQMLYYSAKTIEVTADTPMSIDMDGEFIGYSPMHINVAANKINFLSRA